MQKLSRPFGNTPNDIRNSGFNTKRITTKVVTTKFRSEELCLIIAEAYAHLGKEPEALEYLNLLRSKRITENYVAYTMDNLLKFLNRILRQMQQGHHLPN